jgi:predicted nucleic acid-binding protein
MEDRKRKNNKVVLVDADAFVAFVKLDDANHTRAEQHFMQLKEQQYEFYTPYMVFSEAVTVISQRISHEVAVQFINEVMTPISYIQMLDDWSVKERAIEIFKQQTSKNVSFVDCTNMAFAEKDGFLLFSFDEAYKKNGFRTVEELV